MTKEDRIAEIFSLLFALLVFFIMANIFIKENEPCLYYKNFSIGSIPVRCFKELTQ